jgi:solute carrier family 25 protein 42
MQVFGNVAPYRFMGEAFKHIYRTEGVAGGLYKGLSLNFIKSPVSVAVSFTINDLLKQYYYKVVDG